VATGVPLPHSIIEHICRSHIARPSGQLEMKTGEGGHGWEETGVSIGVHAESNLYLGEFEIVSGFSISGLLASLITKPKGWKVNR
jgi:hypothetical protein